MAPRFEYYDNTYQSEADLIRNRAIWSSKTYIINDILYQLASKNYKHYLNQIYSKSELGHTSLKIKISWCDRIKLKYYSWKYVCDFEIRYISKLRNEFDKGGFTVVGTYPDNRSQSNPLPTFLTISWDKKNEI